MVHTMACNTVSVTSCLSTKRLRVSKTARTTSSASSLSRAHTALLSNSPTTAGSPASPARTTRATAARAACRTRRSLSPTLDCRMVSKLCSRSGGHTSTSASTAASRIAHSVSRHRSSTASAAPSAACLLGINFPITSTARCRTAGSLCWQQSTTATSTDPGKKPAATIEGRRSRVVPRALQSPCSRMFRLSRNSPSRLSSVGGSVIPGALSSK
mmetsp:Transcript_30508/g.73110  ORF Transcript_30508/g.73110 Transcript_30508/m.73110 type:complete len:214 (-) Transcript_30508:34-675(-)